MKSLILLLFVFVSCEGKYYTGMCGVAGCVCYGRMHHEGKLLRHLEPKWDSTIMICDTISADTMIINGDTLIMDYFGRSFLITDSADVVLEIKREFNKKDTMIVYDSLRAIKTLMEQLLRCQTEKRPKEREAMQFGWYIEPDTLPKKDTIFIKNMKDYKEGYVNVLVSPSGRKSVVTIVEGEWQSGDKNMAAEGIGEKIVFQTTDTVKVIMLVSHPLVRCVEWRYGYEVREGKMLWRVHNDGSKTPLFKITSYLDENKKPLPKSIIIWQTRELKQ